jgi:hypothetical protein
MDNQQNVLHQEYECGDKTIRTSRVPPTKKSSCAENVIARTSLPNLWHLAGAIAPLLLQRHKSTINILRKSDVVPTQALPPSKAGGDQNVPQLKAGGNHNIPQHQKATFEVAKWFIEAIVFTRTLWPIISDEKYSMVDEARKQAIDVQDHQWALAASPVGTPSGCQLPGGPSHKINPQTREAISVSFGFYPRLELWWYNAPELYVVKTKD